MAPINDPAIKERIGCIFYIIGRSYRALKFSQCSMINKEAAKRVAFNLQSALISDQRHHLIDQG